jgi:hypothetical protein
MASAYVPRKLVINHPPFHPGEQLVREEMDAFLATHENFGVFSLCAHRGWFKSSFAIERAFYYIQQGFPIGWYCPTLKSIDNALYDMWASALGGKENLLRYFNKTENILTLPGHGPVNFYSLVNISHGAGPTLPFVVMDEAGDIADDAYDSLVYPILEKGRHAYGFGECLNIGTPNRDGNPKNWFWEKIMAGLAPEGDEWEKSWWIPLPADVDENGQLFEVPSPYANPLFTYKWAEKSYRKAQNKQRWLTEWLVKFLSMTGSQFSNIEAACSLPYSERPDGTGVAYWKPTLYPPNTGTYQGGIDIGIRGNHTSICVIDLNTQEQVYMKWFLPGDWPKFYAAVMRAMDLFPGRWILDATGLGDGVPDALIRMGYYVEGEKFSGSNKANYLDRLAFYLERNQVKLFNHPQINLELDRMKREARPSGIFKIEGDGAPDDIPMALALMVKDIPIIDKGQGAREMPVHGMNMFQKSDNMLIYEPMSHFEPNQGKNEQNIFFQ